MQVIVVGAGPVGMFCALTLARRGHSVTTVDRDPGPRADGTWDRRGVMQFQHPHAFRPIVRESLREYLPDVYDSLIAAGTVPARPEGSPEEATGLQCRRSTFERVLWAAAERQPGLTRRTGHAEGLAIAFGRVTGVVVDGEELPADLVVVASGRAGRLGDDKRPPGEGGSCGFGYVSRMYRALPGAEVPRTGTPMVSQYQGYLAMVFPQDNDTLSTLIVRAADDQPLARLRHTSVFQAAASHVPQLAPWVDPALFEPLTEALAGGGLTNTYRPHGPDPVPGLLFVGDAVSTTNPAAGRGISLGLRQARALLSLPTDDPDTRPVAQRFDAWCQEHIRPWFDDHVLWDSTLLRRFHGDDLDLDGPIPSDVICAAEAVDPTIAPAARAYLAMAAPPAVLDPHRGAVRALLRAGWRPSSSDGPTRSDLVQLLA